jgi:WD40 repeat protein
MPRLICKFDNSFNSRITAIDWMNSHDESLIIIGADDGCVRIWKPDLDTGKTKCVSSLKDYLKKNIMYCNHSKNSI